MEKLSIEATKYTPKVEFDPIGAKLDIRGKSYPENTFEFYEPILLWLKNFFSDSAKKIVTFNFEITYYNSSSSKVLYDLFDILEEAVESGHQITINWCYDVENETALEAGEDFQEDFDTLDINLVELNS